MNDYPSQLMALLTFLEPKNARYYPGVYFDRVWIGDKIWVICKDNGVIFDLSGKIKAKANLNDPMSWLII